MLSKLLPVTLSVLLAISLLAGCSDKNTDDPAVSSSVTITAPVESSGTDVGITGTDHTNDAEEAEKEAQIKAKYEISSEHSEILAEEKTAQPIKYAGFTCRYFPTPAKAEGLPIASVTPMYSHSALHNYIEQNKELFDLEYGENSFATAAESYMDSFFVDKGVLVVSFTDTEGGSDYTLKGAWEEQLHVQDMHIDQLMLALKKTAGENTAGHLIVEMDSDFISLWDSISMSIYE